MDNTAQIEHNKRKQVFESFKNELKALIAKYGFERKENDQYNGRDEYMGVNVYFKINGVPYYTETLAELIQETFGDVGLP